MLIEFTNPLVSKGQYERLRVPLRGESEYVNYEVMRKKFGNMMPNGPLSGQYYFLPCLCM